MGFCLFNNVAVAANYLLNDRVCVETFVLFFGVLYQKVLQMFIASDKEASTVLCFDAIK
jgi:hypothetical protein